MTTTAAAVPPAMTAVRFVALEGREVEREVGSGEVSCVERLV
jgi:hypothetical protein